MVSWNGPTVPRNEEALVKDKEMLDHIRKLWLLELIIDSGSFRTAAARAKVTQSALSQAMSQLESAFGRSLLKRGRGVVEPTQHGIELLERVRPILEAVARVSDEGEEDAPELAWLSLGAYESFAVPMIAPLMARLKRRCPGMRLTLRVARSGTLATMVRQGELCMAVVRENDLIGRLPSFPLAEDRFAFYASPLHPAAQLGFAALKEQDIGTLAAGSEGQPLAYRRLVEAAGLARQLTFVSDSYAALMAATLAGAVVAILPESLALTAGGDLVEIRDETLSPKLGRHQILLLSRPNCDDRENEFLASELRAVIAGQARITRPSPRALHCAVTDEEVAAALLKSQEPADAAPERKITARKS